MFRAVLFTALLAGGTEVMAAATADPAHPTVVELYQSQGCSSCPPAIRNVNALADRPGVLILTFAVTYWDQLGWKDTFATAAQTARQWAYARGFHRAQVWTPQVVVDGRADVVGVRSGQIEGLLAATPPRAGPSLALTATAVTVGRGHAPPGGAEVWLVRFDPRTVAVAVGAGENSGRTIDHRNVVHQLVRLGRWSGDAATLPLPPAPVDGWTTAVLVQPAGGAILAAVRG